MARTHHIRTGGSITTKGEPRFHVRRPSPSGFGGMRLGGVAGAAVGGPPGAAVDALGGLVAGEALEHDAPSEPGRNGGGTETA